MSRIVQFPLTRLIIALAFVLAPVLALQALVRALHVAKPVELPLVAVLVIPTVVLSLRAYNRWVERRGLEEFALAGAGRQLAGGLLLGAALFAAVAGILWKLGALRVDDAHSSAAVLPNLVAMAALSAVSEEVLVRGILFRISEEALGSWLALLLSAALFGLGHLGNPHANLWSAAAIAIEAGILLGAAYMFTRSLWLPIGLHAAWNFTEAGVFGAATSGRELPGLMRSTTQGPEWLSGGAFGAEASAVAVLLCLGAGIALLVAAARRGRIVPPSWRRPNALDAGTGGAVPAELPGGS